MKNTRSDKRGYNLLEMMIAMTVTMIMMSMIISLIAVVVNERKRADADFLASSEISYVRNSLYSWYNSFAGYNAYDNQYNFVFVNEVDRCGISVQKGVEEVSYYYYYVTSQTIRTSAFGFPLKLNTVSMMDFTVFDDQVVKVSLYYAGCRQPMVFILSGKDYSNDY